MKNTCHCHHHHCITRSCSPGPCYIPCSIKEYCSLLIRRTSCEDYCSPHRSLKLKDLLPDAFQSAPYMQPRDSNKFASRDELGLTKGKQTYSDVVTKVRKSKIKKPASDTQSQTDPEPADKRIQTSRTDQIEESILSGLYYENPQKQVVYENPQKQVVYENPQKQVDACHCPGCQPKPCCCQKQLANPQCSRQQQVTSCCCASNKSVKVDRPICTPVIIQQRYPPQPALCGNCLSGYLNKPNKAPPPLQTQTGRISQQVPPSDISTERPYSASAHSISKQTRENDFPKTISTPSVTPNAVYCNAYSPPFDFGYQAQNIPFVACVPTLEHLPNCVCCMCQQLRSITCSLYELESEFKCIRCSKSHESNPCRRNVDFCLPCNLNNCDYGTQTKNSESILRSNNIFQNDEGRSEKKQKRSKSAKMKVGKKKKINKNGR